MTSHPLDLRAAMCRHVLGVVETGPELVEVVGDSLKRGYWCDEFCVLSDAWTEPIEVVGAAFVRGCRSMGLSWPDRGEALIGFGLWRSQQILEGVLSPETGARILGEFARAQPDLGGSLELFHALDGTYWCLADGHLDGKLLTGAQLKEAITEHDQAIVDEARRFVRDYSDHFPRP